MNDLQIPFHDPPVVNLVLSFLETLKPAGIVLNGDIVDCYECSDFDKNPKHRDISLTTERFQAWKVLDRVVKITPEVWWILGNHEDRIRRYVWRNAKAFAEELEFANLFRLKDHGVRWKDYGDHLMLGKLLITHGNFVSQHSTFTARRHFDRYGNSILVGHSHRLGIYYRTNVKGIHAAYENGCLCSLKPDYIKNPDWQQGFTLVQVDDGGWFHVQQIPILNRSRFYYGKDKWGR